MCDNAVNQVLVLILRVLFVQDAETFIAQTEASETIGARKAVLAVQRMFAFVTFGATAKRIAQIASICFVLQFAMEWLEGVNRSLEIAAVVAVCTVLRFKDVIRIAYVFALKEMVAAGRFTLFHHNCAMD